MPDQHQLMAAGPRTTCTQLFRHRPVRFFGATAPDRCPQLALHDFLKALDIPQESHLRLVRLLRDVDGGGVGMMRSGNELVLVADVSLAHGIAEACASGASDPDISADYLAASRRAYLTMAG